MTSKDASSRVLKILYVVVTLPTGTDPSREIGKVYYYKTNPGHRLVSKVSAWSY